MFSELWMNYDFVRSCGTKDIGLQSTSFIFLIYHYRP